MLITFSSPAYGDITMFGDVAIQLLKLMGLSGTVPGALLAQDVPAALARLEAIVSEDKPLPDPEDASQDEDAEPPVSLSHRALPIIELLKAAAKQEDNVMWDMASKSGVGI